MAEERDGHLRRRKPRSDEPLIGGHDSRAFLGTSVEPSEHTDPLHHTGYKVYWVLSAFADAVRYFITARGAVALDTLVVIAVATALVTGSVTGSTIFLTLVTLSVLVLPIVPAALVFVFELLSLQKKAEEAAQVQSNLEDVRSECDGLERINGPLIRNVNQLSHDVSEQQIALERTSTALNVKKGIIRASFDDRIDIMSKWFDPRDKVAPQKFQSTVSKRKQAPPGWFARVMMYLGDRVTSWLPASVKQLWQSPGLHKAMRAAWRGVFCFGVLAFAGVTTLSLLGAVLTFPLVAGALSVCGVIGLSLAIMEYRFGDDVNLSFLKEALTRITRERIAQKNTSIRNRAQQSFLRTRQKWFERKVARRAAKQKALEDYTFLEGDKFSSDALFKAFTPAEPSVCVDGDAEDEMQEISLSPDEEAVVASQKDSNTSPNESGLWHPLLESALLAINFSGLAFLGYKMLQNEAARYWIGQGLGHIGLTLANVFTSSAMLGGFIGMGIMIALATVGMFFWTRHQQKKKTKLAHETQALRYRCKLLEDEIKTIEGNLETLSQANRDKIAKLRILNSHLEKQQLHGVLEAWLYTKEDFEAYEAQLTDCNVFSSNHASNSIEFHDSIWKWDSTSELGAQEAVESEEADGEEASTGNEVVRRRLYLIGQFFQGSMTPLIIGLFVCGAATVAFTGIPATVTLASALLVGLLYVLVAHTWGYDLKDEISQAEKVYAGAEKVLGRMETYHSQMIERVDAAYELEHSLHRKIAKLRDYRIPLLEQHGALFQALPDVTDVADAMPMYEGAVVSPQGATYDVFLGQQ